MPGQNSEFISTGWRLLYINLKFGGVCLQLSVESLYFVRLLTAGVCQRRDVVVQSVTLIRQIIAQRLQLVLSHTFTNVD